MDIDTDHLLEQCYSVKYTENTCLSNLFRGAMPFPRTLTRSTPRCYAALVSLVTLTILNLAPTGASASFPLLPYDGSRVTSIAATRNGDGFWVQLDTQELARTISLYGAPELGSVDLDGSIAAIPGRNAYWVVTYNGEIHQRGGAPLLCSNNLRNCSGYQNARDPIVGAAARPNGQGLWALSYDGKVWTAGDAQSYGDVAWVTNPDVVPTGIVATPSGNGYYIVASDGGVFTFGDAVFFGSTGGNPPGGRYITGIALSITDDGQVNGYWLVNKDGEVFAFGNAPFFGSSGGNAGSNYVTSIVSYPSPAPGQAPQRTLGYAWVHTNGQVGFAQRQF
jgi:hypothetical protein